MNVHPTTRARTVLAVAVPAWTATTLLLGRTALDVLGAAREGPLDLDAALAGLAAGLGLALLAWTALAAACTALAAALPAGTAAARRARAVSERVTPPALRRLLVVAVGAALASSSVPAQAATGGGAVTGTGAPATGHGVVAAAPLRTGAAPAADPVPRGGLDPGWAAPTTARPPSLPVVPPAVDPASLDPAALDPAWAPGTVRRLRPDPSAGTVVVRRGDSLWDLAARQLGPAATDAEIAHAWPQWYRANRSVIGPDPDVLSPGQRLAPPAPSGGAA